jgi:siroheme synthase (precorrin-2 oxidase/ferrochelatase)
VADTPGYPATLRLADRRVLVVGGGTVATRRIPALLDAEALVDVIAPDASTEIREAAGPDGSGGGSGGSSRATSSSRSRPVLAHAARPTRPRDVNRGGSPERPLRRAPAVVRIQAG